MSSKISFFPHFRTHLRAHGAATPPDYILNTFPIIREQDESAHGRMRTRDRIPAYTAALQAGHPTPLSAADRSGLAQRTRRAYTCEPACRDTVQISLP